MITYLTKQFQAVPALMSIYRQLGGHFVSTRGNTIRAIRKDNPSVEIHKYIEKIGRFSSGFRYLNNADVIVTGAPYRNILSQFSAKKYMIFTGTTASLTVKQIRDDHAHFDKLCVIGPRMMRTVMQANLNTEIVQAGYFPFLSFPERKSAQSLNVLAVAGIDAAKKTILYLPRGEPYGSFDMMMPKFIEQLPDTDMNLIVRPHPSQSVKLHMRDRLKFLLVNKYIKKNGNIFMDMNHFRLADLLATADLVITDANSPADEALFYDVPQLLIETPRLSRATVSETMRSEMASEEDISSAMRIYDNGPIFHSSESDAIAAIHHAIESAGSYAQAREVNYAFVFGERGFSAQQMVIDELRQFSS